jgi:transposase
MDMSQAYTSAIKSHPELQHAYIVHDPFHVMKRALEALDELRRATFFRAGPQLRALGRGKRWLFLRAWERMTPQDRDELKKLLRCNRQLATAYQVVEELRDVLHAPDEFTMAMGLVHVMKRIERRSNVPMRKLHDSLDEHFDEIVALGRHHPPTGRVEALNNNWETAVRQARGYRNLDFLLLKLRFMTANPVRTDNGVRRFLALGLPTPYAKAA